MAITPKEKELAAVGISVAAGCRPCLDYHFKAVRKAGASDDEINQAMLDGISVRTTATESMADFALDHLGENMPNRESTPSLEGHPTKILTSIGAAFAVNCVVSLENHLDSADKAGVLKEDIENILELSQMIKGRAAHHAERLCRTKHKIDISEKGKL